MNVVFDTNGLRERHCCIYQENTPTYSCLQHITYGLDFIQRNNASNNQPASSRVLRVVPSTAA